MKVSIAMCTYNGQKFLKEQLNSLLRQSKQADEIIIVDDKSNDDTVKIIEEFKKNSKLNILLYVNKHNLGVFKNFEKAISLCNGEIIFCCDQDDVWQFDKIEKHLKSFDKETMLVFSNASVTEADTSKYIAPLWSDMKFQSSYKNIVYLGGSVAGCCLSFKRELLDGMFPFPNKVYHDDWLITIAIIKGEVKYIDEELMYYRQHGANVVGITRGNKFSYYKSLFTNPDSYIDHYDYIYQRHQLMYEALIDSKIVSENQIVDLKNNLEFSKLLANIRNTSKKDSLNKLRKFKRIGYYKKYSKFNFFIDYYFVLSKGK